MADKIHKLQHISMTACE